MPPTNSSPGHHIPSILQQSPAGTIFPKAFHWFLTMTQSSVSKLLPHNDLRNKLTLNGLLCFQFRQCAQKSRNSSTELVVIDPSIVLVLKVLKERLQTFQIGQLAKTRRNGSCELIFFNPSTHLIVITCAYKCLSVFKFPSSEGMGPLS